MENSTKTGSSCKEKSKRRKEQTLDPEIQSDVMCIECSNQEADIHCLVCKDNFCELCFSLLHRKGTRKRHDIQQIAKKKEQKEQKVSSPSLVQANTDQEDRILESKGVIVDSFRISQYNKDGELFVQTSRCPSPPPDPCDQSKSWFSASAWFDDSYQTKKMKVSKHVEELQKEREIERKQGKVRTNSFMVELAKSVPVRLDQKERKLLRLLENTLAVSNYVVAVDNPVFASSSAEDIVLDTKLQSRRQRIQIDLITSFLTSVVISIDYHSGQMLARDGDFKKFESFFQKVFEIARRYKVLNPDRLRTQYSKLLYLIQDCLSENIKNQLEINVLSPIKTVYSFLKEKDCLDMLSDKYIFTATHEIIPSDSSSRKSIQHEIKKKETAVKLISRKYSSKSVSPDELSNCLYSIGEYFCYLRFNRDPINTMLTLLNNMKGNSLEIKEGVDGARLSHSTETQFSFCRQSLALWRDFQHNMFVLWILAERDLLTPPFGVLRHTGQGVHRVQLCHRTLRAAQSVLLSLQLNEHSWVGSSIIHMGDHNVPNSIMFIEKYTQVPYILTPLALVLKHIKETYESDNFIKKYIKSTFGSIDSLFELILSDFFRHAFDGSGADNFYDAGSCVDGRMTSAWHWCNNLHTKPYKTVFLLSNFIGFDGALKD